VKYTKENVYSVIKKYYELDNELRHLEALKENISLPELLDKFIIRCWTRYVPLLPIEDNLIRKAYSELHNNGVFNWEED